MTILVLVPTPFIMMITVYEQLNPLRSEFREAVEKHPSFPPTCTGFLICGSSKYDPYRALCSRLLAPCVQTHRGF